MEITQVKVFPVQEEKLKAFVSLVFDHCFMVNDIKVIQGKDGLFLSMPSRRKKSGEFKDVAHPLNHETRRRIEECVLEEYRQTVDDETPRRPDRQDGDEDEPAVARPSREPGSRESSRPETPSRPEPPSRPGAQSRPEAVPPSETPYRSGVPGRADAPGTSPVFTPPAGASVGPAPLAAEAVVTGGEKEGGEDDEERTLEEVQEMHLRDSFWSVS